MKFARILWVYSLFVLSMTLLFSCEQKMENTDGFSEDEKNCIAFRFNYPDSRVHTDEDGSGHFENGDKIGLYLGSEGKSRHYVLTMEDGNWKPYIKKTELDAMSDGERVCVSAYYPAVEGAPAENEMKHSFSVASDQSVGWKQSDFLWSTQSVNLDELNGHTMTMFMHHAMHRLTVNLKPAAGTALPQEVTVKVRNCRSGDFSVLSGEIIPADNSDEWIIPERKADGSYETLIFPSPLSRYEGDWVEITSGEKTAYFKTPASVGGSSYLESGKSSVLNLTVNIQGDEDTDHQFAGKICWIKGRVFS